MITVGLTGNIGTGKSIVSRIFSSLGVPVYLSDVRAKAILDSETVMPALVAYFGEQVINPEGKADRKKIAGIVFSDAAKLAKLNGLIHPLVRQDFEKWRVMQDAPYIIHEAAILFESGFYQLADKIVVVTAPVQLCIERVMQRDQATREQVLERMHNQWPQADKQKLADYVIFNDEKQLVIPQVLTVHTQLSLQ